MKTCSYVHFLLLSYKLYTNFKNYCCRQTKGIECARFFFFVRAGAHYKLKVFTMKKLFVYFLMLGAIPLIFTNCKDDEDPKLKSEFELLTEYMGTNALDLTDVLNGWVKTAGSINVDPVDFSVPDYYVIDIRAAADFEAGHIKDANNTTLANVLTEATKAGNMPILVVCYTGQSAARAVGALRLMEIEAYSLKWGMSGWHQDLSAKWEANATDYASPNWVTTGDPIPNKEFSAPTLTTNGADGRDILEKRVEAVLSMPWTISKVDVLDNPSNYFINNKWPLDSWNEYGHINGAYRIDEELNLAGLKYLDPDADMVTYCYTGQTSAITTTWLQVMGYTNARSLTFGVNGIAHSDLVTGTAGSAHKKSWKGEGSGSVNNFGYYDSEGNLHGPE